MRSASCTGIHGSYLSNAIFFGVTFTGGIAGFLGGGFGCGLVAGSLLGVEFTRPGGDVAKNNKPPDLEGGGCGRARSWKIPP
ncbi:hypothetical protein BN381_450031 [Candidatus Microthrix parvicella RN1]|uniref:Uncharacterized protein n=1 Tax=Candidatus Neomicrothrix parvicella RN1 TaxID=1229780 RepID=R4Z219_9ACTN|nr:hypothetical protein BN381_450031 [Candidatus Microthrix parvicella RN1]